MKRAILKAIEVLVIISGVVFFFTPLHTATQIVILGASIVVFLLCVTIASRLDDNNTGYWPQQANWTEGHNNAQSSGPQATDQHHLE